MIFQPDSVAALALVALFAAPPPDRAWRQSGGVSRIRSAWLLWAIVVVLAVSYATNALVAPEAFVAAMSKGFGP